MAIKIQSSANAARAGAVANPLSLRAVKSTASDNRYLEYLPGQMRATRLRKAIIHVLLDMDDPFGMGALDIQRVLLQQGEGITLGSIYRTLADLCKGGKADCLEDGSGKGRYRLRESRNTCEVLIFPQRGQPFLAKNPQFLLALSRQFSEAGLPLPRMVTIRTEG